MTKENWYQLIADNREGLVGLVRSFHPNNRPPETRRNDRITAANPEMACVVIRQRIRDEHPNMDAVKEFEEALDNKDTTVILAILNQVWFGVPESTSCWRIPGFKVMVDLMEDFPEE